MSNDPVANYLFGAPGGLAQNKADYADNVTSAFFVISQLQAKGLATVDITTFIGSANTSVNFVNNFEPGTSPDIITVRVYNQAGPLIEYTSDLANFNDPKVDMTGIGIPTATVLHLAVGDKLEWVTDSEHDQVLIEDGAGKFDIGAFDISGDIRFEDGRTIDHLVQITVGTEA